MCWDISLHTDIEIIKKTFPQLRDERRQLDYNSNTIHLDILSAGYEYTEGENTDL
ncbi:hypothetical protein [Sphingobacterium puteale]|uniref:hypothetical protein n=1 Tax=Sphingobacterium puteale TaxID=2420510 RepID=UPI003D993A1E